MVWQPASALGRNPCQALIREGGGYNSKTTSKVSLFLASCSLRSGPCSWRRGLEGQRDRQCLCPIFMGVVTSDQSAWTRKRLGRSIVLHSMLKAPMSLLTFFTTIEDAYYYYFQAKGASDTKNGRVIKQRHLRTAVLLGWVAVDDAMACWTKEVKSIWPRDCKGPRSFPKIRFIFGQLGVPPPDEFEFDLHRGVRNEITHPSGLSEPLLTLRAVGAALAYCKRLMKTMYPHLVVREQWH